MDSAGNGYGLTLLSIRPMAVLPALSVVYRPALACVARLIMWDCILQGGTKSFYSIGRYRDQEPMEHPPFATPPPGRHWLATFFATARDWLAPLPLADVGMQ